MAKSKKRKKKKGGQAIVKLTPENYVRKVARKLPIYEVLITEDFKTEGSAIVVISRKKKNGELIAGFYTIDSYCLGLMFSDFKIYYEVEYRDHLELIEDINQPKFVSLDANYAFNYIYGAIEYADELGFQEHKSFRITQFILDDIDTIEFVDIEFGKDGKPVYVMSKELDNKRNLDILQRNIGPGNYDLALSSDFDTENSPFSNMIDSLKNTDEFIENEDEEWENEEMLAFTEDIINSMSDNGRDQYYLFSTLNYVIWLCYDKNLQSLTEDYLHNQKHIKIKIDQYLSTDSDLKLRKLMTSELELLNCVIENILVYRDIHYLQDPFIIESFDDKHSPDDQFFYSCILLFLKKTGIEKFNLILPFIDFGIDEVPHNEQYIKVRQQLNHYKDHESLLDVPFDEFTDVLLEYTTKYEDAFGEIELDKIDWVLHDEEE